MRACSNNGTESRCSGCFENDKKTIGSDQVIARVSRKQQNSIDDNERRPTDTLAFNRYAAVDSTWNADSETLIHRVRSKLILTSENVRAPARKRSRLAYTRSCFIDRTVQYR